jgi:histidinol-phosphate/aromatic aminotransferase/cobyric acid decarboxylase-like protein
MKIVEQLPEYIRTLIPYEPGKPIEEVEREYGIADSTKLASNENPWARRRKHWKQSAPSSVSSTFILTATVST